MSGNRILSFPSAGETRVLVLSMVLWLAVTAMFVGLRPEHIFLGILIACMFEAAPASRRLVVALLPFIVFGISYDWMNIVHNYEVNPVDISGIYETEKSLFGIAAGGELLTPNEFLGRHTSAVMDFLGGFFYLC